MKPETIRRILVVGVCFLAVMMLHLWPADAQSPSGQPREPMPTRSPQPEPTPSDTPTQSPSAEPDRSGPPADPPSTHRPWDPDERWNTRQPQPPQTSEPSGPPTEDPTKEPSRPPSDRPTRPPTIDPSDPTDPPETPPSTSPTPTDPPTSEPPPTTDPPTDPPTSDPPRLPAPVYELTGSEDGYVLTWNEVEGADTYYLYVDDGTETQLIPTPPDRTYVVPAGTVAITLRAVEHHEHGTTEGKPAEILIPPTDDEGGSEGDSGGGDPGDGDSGDEQSDDQRPSGSPTP